MSEHSHLIASRASRVASRTGLWSCGVALGLALAAAFAQPSRAQAQIESPGAHPKYGVELDAHLVWQWDDQWWWDDDGIGVGMRASIPVIDNGPVTTINNNLAITFGLDWAHFDNPCSGGPYSCGGNDFWLPVAVQWNFFLSKVVSLYPELGLGIHHSSFDWGGPAPNGCATVNGFRYCGNNDSRTDIDLVLWLGARFLLSEDVAITLRIGTPSLLVGASFLL